MKPTLTDHKNINKELGWRMTTNRQRLHTRGDLKREQIKVEQLKH